MNCLHCKKWAGPHLVLPGQDDSILCKCSLTDWANKEPQPPAPLPQNLDAVLSLLRQCGFRTSMVDNMDGLGARPCAEPAAPGDCLYWLHKLIEAAYEAGVAAGREQMP